MPPMFSVVLVVGILYPTSATAPCNCSTVMSSGPNPTEAFREAFSVARFTATSVTPGISARACSTWATQDAQVMPSTGTVIFLGVSVLVGME